MLIEMHLFSNTNNGSLPLLSFQINHQQKFLSYSENIWKNSIKELYFFSVSFNIIYTRFMFLPKVPVSCIIKWHSCHLKVMKYNRYLLCQSKINNTAFNRTSAFTCHITMISYSESSFRCTVQYKDTIY